MGAAQSAANAPSFSSVPESLFVDSPLVDAPSLSDLRTLRLVCRDAAAAVGSSRRWAAARARATNARSFAADVFRTAAGGARRSMERALDGVRVLSVQVQSAEGRVFAVASVTEESDGLGGSEALVCVPFGCSAWKRRSSCQFAPHYTSLSFRHSLKYLCQKDTLKVTSAANIWCFRVRGDIAVVAAKKKYWHHRCSAWLKLFDLSDIQNPAEVDSVLLEDCDKPSVCFLNDSQIAVAAGGSLLVFSIQSHSNSLELARVKEIVLTRAPRRYDTLLHIAGNDNFVAATQFDRLLLFDLNKSPGFEQVLDLYPQEFFSKIEFPKSYNGRMYIQGLFIDRDWIFLDATEHSGCFLALNWRTGKRVWHRSFSAQAYITSSMVAITRCDGNCSLWGPLNKASIGHVEAPGFEFSPGPSCVHFDHSAVVVGGGSQGPSGRFGSGINLWRVNG